MPLCIANCWLHCDILPPNRDEQLRELYDLHPSSGSSPSNHSGSSEEDSTMLAMANAAQNIEHLKQRFPNDSFISTEQYVSAPVVQKSDDSDLEIAYIGVRETFAERGCGEWQ